MKVVDIVPMRAEHIKALMPYEHEMFGTEAWTAEGYRAELADTKSRYYVAAVDENGGLLGWAGIRVVGESAEILTVGVIPAARRSGIGERLLAMLLEEARRRDAAEAFLEVRVDNAPAERLYEKAQFVRVGMRRGYYAGGRVDAVVMRRAL